MKVSVVTIMVDITIGKGLKDIDTWCTAQELVTIALDTIIPQIKAYANISQFPWQEQEFIVCDKKWVDLTKYTNDHLYFYDKCLHSGKGKNLRAAMVFKTAQFSHFIIVPVGQWLELEDFREKCECKRPMSQASFILAP